MKNPEQRIADAQRRNARIYREWARIARKPAEKAAWEELARSAEACAESVLREAGVSASSVLREA